MCLTIKRFLESFVFPLLWVALFVLFQVSAKYHFFYMEQFQLFQFSSNYLKEYLFEVGGLVFYISNFLMQFYALNFLGATISSSLLTFIAYLSCKILDTSGKREYSYLGILPVIPFLVLHLLNYYNLAGTISFLLMLLAVLLTVKSKHENLVHIMILLSLILFWITGPFVYQYLLFMALLYAIKLEKRHFFDLCFVSMIMVFLGFVVFRLGMVADLSNIFMLDSFYQPRMEPPFFIYLPFIFFVGSVLFVWLITILSLQLKPIISYSITLLIVCLTGFVFLKNELPEQLKNNFLKELDYYSRTGQWDKILSKGEGKMDNHLYMNYINLALLKKGELTEEMFMYDQRNINSLMVTWDKTQLVSNLLSDIAFATGQIAFAQNMSFEALVNYESGVSGRCLQRLVETNLISGAYPVASKYLDILDKTLFYRKWAAEYRTILNTDINNEIKIMVDPRSSIDNLLGFDPLLQELINCIYSNPNNHSLIEFTKAYLMLSKDMSNIKRFVETFYGTETLPSLSKSLQEAVIVYSEHDPAYWVKYGISNDIINRFSSFKQLILENRGKTSIASTANRYYGDTFWYYYMFKA